MMVFASSNYILFCNIWLLSLRRLFSSRNREGADLEGRRGGEELGEAEGGETNQYLCIRIKSICKSRGKKNLLFSLLLDEII